MLPNRKDGRRLDYHRHHSLHFSNVFPIHFNYKAFIHSRVLSYAQHTHHIDVYYVFLYFELKSFEYFNVFIFILILIIKNILSLNIKNP